MNEVAIQAVRVQLSQVEDDLYRANLCASKADPDAQWGSSGETLAEIIGRYERRKAELVKALEELGEKP